MYCHAKGEQPLKIQNTVCCSVHIALSFKLQHFTKSVNMT